MTPRVRAAGISDVGCQRVVNEDRFLVDEEHGVFIVVDGVGGQAAGGRAADTALNVLRQKLIAGNGAAGARIREAITIANNEVHREASSRPEWNGMACVLTAAMMDGDRLVIGHVGDTRLYKIRNGHIQKITADHSPVGEREDAGELSELDAMSHPRRNEVYRDVGSEPHAATDADFVDVQETPMEPDSAVLLCSDGLTDLVPSEAIQRVVREHAGRPDRVAQALIKAANDAGGKDNVTVVYVEGTQFLKKKSGRVFRILVPVLLALAGLGWWWRSAGYPLPAFISGALSRPAAGASASVIVRSGGSIAAAVGQAQPGSTILVEAGEYRERLVLRPGVRVVSLTSRGATLRLPGDATDADAAVVATDAPHAELAGFRIVGDAATPLGIGVLARSPNVRFIDLEITGAARTAIDLGAGDNVQLLASDIHGNPGSGLALRANSSARIAHNTFISNGTAVQNGPALLIEPNARPLFVGNVFRKSDPGIFAFLDPTARARVLESNWFPDAVPPAGARPRSR